MPNNIIPITMRLGDTTYSGNFDLFAQSLVDEAVYPKREDIRKPKSAFTPAPVAASTLGGIIAKSVEKTAPQPVRQVVIVKSYSQGMSRPNTSILENKGPKRESERTPSTTAISEPGQG